MSIISGLRTFLLTDATLSGLVGVRLYPNILPQNPTMPAVTITIISGDRQSSNDGPGGLNGPRVQIDCWGTSYASADAVFEAIRKKLDGKKSGIILGAFMDSDRDFYEPEPKYYRRSADYFVWHTEVVA